METIAHTGAGDRTAESRPSSDRKRASVHGHRPGSGSRFAPTSSAEPKQTTAGPTMFVRYMRFEDIDRETASKEVEEFLMDSNRSRDYLWRLRLRQIVDSEGSAREQASQYMAAMLTGFVVAITLRSGVWASLVAQYNLRMNLQGLFGPFDNV